MLTTNYLNFIDQLFFADIRFHYNMNTIRFENIDTFLFDIIGDEYRFDAHSDREWS